MWAALERYFDIKGRGSSVGRELRGAVATFLTMAYILVANPAILKQAQVPQESAVACTALAAGLCCVLMGLWANFPIALASGMGLNAVVAYQVAEASGSWQIAMGVVVLDGVVVFVFVLSGLREAMLQAIPLDLRRAIGAGIGLFIAFIGAVNAGIVKADTVPGKPVKAGSLAEPEAALAVAGLLVMAVLLALRVRGAIVLGILFGTVVALLCGMSKLPEGLSPPSFEIIGRADVLGALQLSLLPFLFTLVLVDFFDTLGTVTAIAEQSGLHDERGNIPGLRRVLLADAVSASVGGVCGVSSVTSYIESAAGVAEGARTGLHSVFVGLFFLVAILLAPLAAIVPAAATAPALILVGFLMCEQIVRIDFGRRDTAIPAFVTLVTLPTTWSITHGIGYGFLTYCTFPDRLEFSLKLLD
ncbi:MAG TPA: NCS2 family permease [Gemmataceae bacterium]|nr:NCS2 family permease [Gemmataceae bacterium]